MRTTPPDQEGSDLGRHHKTLTQTRGTKQKESSVLAMAAFVISCLATTFTLFSFQEKSADDSIVGQYQMFSDLTKLPLSDPSISHLVVMPDRYEEVKQLVLQANQGVSKQDIAKLELKERFVANYILTLFEERLYDYKRASVPLVDNGKREFSKAVLDYFTGRVLRNPRLLWYWSSKGGGLSTYYESDTREYYDTHVLHDLARPLTENPDPDGPFAPTK